MSRESKAELTDRLRREGRFDEFKKRREELKAEGIPANEAWYQAAVEFPPESPRLRPAGGYSPAIEPWVKWTKDTRDKINAADNAFDWLLRALPVKVPAKAAASKPELYTMLLAIRGNPVLLQEFYRLAMKRWAEGGEAADIARPPFTIKELWDSCG